ncbi:hypothetical protein [Devosia sp. 1635]|uniref:hypothetical protein n=1 Tax=Devosia sp. 1635 TaxID=2726066 RepID=UPI0015642D4B|nr:hypothetical protein [Devosia sp. 1635]
MAALLLALPGVAVAEDTEGEAGGLPEPRVVMEANPPPPFTYWAPEGSTIINHPNGGGVWIAEQNGERAAYYFGDQCKASDFQELVGQPLDSFPADEVGEDLRTACTECAVTSDLRFDRVNVWFDQDTSIIDEISCG